MRNVICIILFYTVGLNLVYAQGYYSDRTPDMPGSFHKTSHTHNTRFTKTEYDKLDQMIDAVVEVVKKAYPQPVGVDVGPYGGIFDAYPNGPSEVSGGPYRIYVTIPFYELYKTKTGSTEASGEYSSHIDIWINNVRYLLQGNYVHDGNNRIYRAPYPGIPVNGFPKYNNLILMLPPGKSLPWRPTTKQEYIENVIGSLKAQQGLNAAQKKGIEVIEQFLQSMPVSERNQIAYIKKAKFFDSEVTALQYSGKWEGFSTPSDPNADQLVIIDENFYNKKLPRNSFQIIVIDRAAYRSPGSVNDAIIKIEKERHDRMNTIVRNTELLPLLQKMFGKDPSQFASSSIQTKSTYVFKKINDKKIDRKVDSAFRHYTVNLPKVPTVSVNNPGGPPDIKTPSQNQEKLLLASRRLETKEELKSYLDELEQKLTIGLGTSVNYYNNASDNNGASYGYWLMDKPKQSLLLAVRAAKDQPDNDTYLNNLAANLSVCGIDYMAVPLYIVCLKKEPTNSTITNNIGQSYLALGDINNATTYLKQAIGSTPYHHHANNSLGYIYAQQGNKDGAIRCFENSLRGSFTLSGFNGLRKLDWKKAIKLINYIKNRYKQPDYLNFNKYQKPEQCITLDETETRKAEHSAYHKILSNQITRYYKLRQQQIPVANKEAMQILERQKKGKAIIKPFQIFANALLVSIQQEFNDKIPELEKQLVELEKQKLHLELEYEESIKDMDKEFEPRSEKVGEGNGDPTLEEEICEARTTIVNHYLPLFADNNGERYKKIVYAYKDYLNDRLYWEKLANAGEEQYRLAYYDIVLAMLHVMQEVRLTTLEGFCGQENAGDVKSGSVDFEEPHCPLPVGIEIPFVIGKVSFDCEGWGLEVGEAVILNIDHKIGGETTIAIGPGLSFYSTPKLFGHEELSLNPGIDANSKGQLFLTFEGDNLVDGGFLWEAEIDIKGLGKPAEIKQNFTFAVNKGFTYEGLLTDLGDKIFDVPPETQVNKNIKIYKPPH